MRREDFEKEYLNVKGREAALEKRSTAVAFFRFAAFVLFMIGLALIIAGKTVMGYSLTGIFLILFIFLLFYHGKIKEKQLYEESMGKVLFSYIARFGDDWQHFPDDGADFLGEEDTVMADLDILGPHSLYQFLTVAQTGKGKQHLADLLRGEPREKAEIAPKQAAVAELAEKTGFSIHLQALSGLFTLRQQEGTWDDMDEFLANLKGKRTGFSHFLTVCAWVLPVLTLGSLGLVIAGWIPPAWFMALIVLQWAFAGFGYRRNMRILQPLYSMLRYLQTYGEIFSALENEEFRSPYLKRIQSKFREGVGASWIVRKLAAIGEAANLHYNPFIYGFLAAFLMWDYQCLIAFNRWQRRYCENLSSWFLAVGEIEALMSLAVLCHVKGNYSFPAILEEEKPRLHGESLAHPLLPDDQAVGNDCDWSGGTYVITGSNMSGKTTFLRTLGLNLILTYAGAPVVARSFAATPMRIFTSMRVGDDVTKGISTFYGELLRIKEMVTYSKEGKPMIALIDEIFKGTNSADRIIGAKEAVRRLTKPWGMTLVSTHDFELCDLEKDAAVAAKNYHFSEYYEGDALRFDYLLRGKAAAALQMPGILLTETGGYPLKRQTQKTE